MTAVAAGSRGTQPPRLRSQSRSRTSAVRAWWRRHPELPFVAAITAAWIVLAVGHWHNHGVGADQWHFDLGAWMLMCIAMMLPGALAATRRVSFTSLWRRRHRSASIFAGAYLAVWVVFGAAGAGVAAGFEALTNQTFNPGPVAVFIALVVAAGWQLSTAKRTFLFRCHLELPVAPRGWPGDRSLIRYGWFHARACVGSCGPIMAAMLLGAHDFHLMAPLAALTTIERYQRRPQPMASAAAIAVVAVLSLLPVS